MAGCSGVTLITLVTLLAFFSVLAVLTVFTVFNNERGCLAVGVEDCVGVLVLSLFGELYVVDRLALHGEGCGCRFDTLLLELLALYRHRKGIRCSSVHSVEDVFRCAGIKLSECFLISFVIVEVKSV